MRCKGVMPPPAHDSAALQEAEKRALQAELDASGLRREVDALTAARAESQQQLMLAQNETQHAMARADQLHADLEQLSQVYTQLQAHASQLEDKVGWGWVGGGRFGFVREGNECCSFGPTYVSSFVP